MTDTKVLADALVEAGIGKSFGDFGVWRYRIGDSGLLSDKEFITDWRVAGKVLEELAKDGFHISQGEALTGQYDCHVDHIENDMRSYSSYNESLPRSINEAWYAAKENDV